MERVYTLPCKEPLSRKLIGRVVRCFNCGDEYPQGGTVVDFDGYAFLVKLAKPYFLKSAPRTSNKAFASSSRTPREADVLEWVMCDRIIVSD